WYSIKEIGWYTMTEIHWYTLVEIRQLLNTQWFEAKIANPPLLKTASQIEDWRSLAQWKTKQRAIILSKMAQIEYLLSENQTKSEEVLEQEKLDRDLEAIVKDLNSEMVTRINARVWELETEAKKTYKKTPQTDELGLLLDDLFDDHKKTK
ncbi:MAG: hypothetical protein K2X47_06545, partial [Bdellovibrionales bacterium]|nr:hypothetical protein [Bdellovibrionales bacterium]